MPKRTIWSQTKPGLEAWITSIQLCVSDVDQIIIRAFRLVSFRVVKRCTVFKLLSAVYSDQTDHDWHQRDEGYWAPPGKKNQLSSTAVEYLALQEMEALISVGDQRDMFYRIEAGSLLVVVSDNEGNQIDCMTAGPSDYVGLGFLQTHTTSAHALTDTTVSCYEVSSSNELSALDPKLRSQLERDTTREFLVRKAKMLSDQHRVTPLQKVARLMLALSDVALREGRALHGVSDAMDSKFTASLLGMDVELCTACINDLAECNLIKRDPDTGFLVADTAGLAELG
ncbi:MAG: Crp/Fnr family transcriptional regulator [Hyphomicrobiaceae bacterium]